MDAQNKTCKFQTFNAYHAGDPALLDLEPALDSFVARFLNGSLTQGDWVHIKPQISFVARNKASRSQPARTHAANDGSSALAPTPSEHSPSELLPLDDRYYIGSIETMPAELDDLFGTSSNVHARMRSNTTSRYRFSEGTTRALCRLYWQDVCCLDVRFRTPCEAVNVTCDDVARPAPPPPPPLPPPLLDRASGLPLPQYDWLQQV